MFLFIVVVEDEMLAPNSELPLCNFQLKCWMLFVILFWFLIQTEMKSLIIVAIVIIVQLDFSHWIVLLTILDVKNAFNSARWIDILEAHENSFRVP